ncbi:MAG: Ig-like domain-containing protein [Prevotellaceae bacterium]|jgi:uncharacterized protein (TIGR02145 family)|nr:Ig-like domain-containing protein [Prevotellaceae bacterium]
MKKILYSVLTLTLGLVLSGSSCNPMDAPVTVTGVTLNKATLYFACNTTVPLIDPAITLTAIVEPTDAANKDVTWDSSVPTVATVVDGVVTPLSVGTTVITVTTSDSGLTSTCAVTVDLLGTCTFATSQTWTVSGSGITQTWSDAVVASGANKTAYDGGVSGGPYNADWRSNPGQSGSLFSWEAVNQYKTRLCPDGWSVPTKQDFIDLDIAFDGDGSVRSSVAAKDKYLFVWGGAFGGYCAADGTLSNQDIIAYYSSQTEFPTNHAYTLYFTSLANINPQIAHQKILGSTLRCIK